MIALAIGAAAGGVVACVLGWKQTGVKRVMAVLAGLAALAMGVMAIWVQFVPSPPPEVKTKDL